VSDPHSGELAHNRELWDTLNRAFTDEEALARWSADEITWGLFGVPESEVGALGEVAGRDVVELGCGTAYVSAWLARRGARPVGVDLSPAQLATARRCQHQLGLTFPLVEADAGDVPLPDGCADLVVSEYGASVWCDPAAWLPEAARLLRPGGRLAFLTNSVLATLTVPEDDGFAGDRLLRPQRDAYRVAWPSGGVEYHPGHGDWVRLLRRHGFTVEALHELYAPPGAPSADFYVIATPEWAQRWPVEDLWVATVA
jgi:SAM-dependent methyltransferase